MYLIALLTAAFTFAAPADPPVEWLGETTVDVGDIPRGQDHTYVYYFRNLTGAPLVIDNVRAGCGCTATDWAEAPVEPGEEGQIRVTYDARDAGYFRKGIKVFFAGHRGGHKLWLEGYVEPRAAAVEGDRGER